MLKGERRCGHVVKPNSARDEGVMWASYKRRIWEKDFKEENLIEIKPPFPGPPTHSSPRRVVTQTQWKMWTTNLANRRREAKNRGLAVKKGNIKNYGGVSLGGESSSHETNRYQ